MLAFRCTRACPPPGPLRPRRQALAEIRNLNLWGNGISDVSVVQRMPNVEVLSLSVNKISTLKDFSYCPALQELYLRKNEARRTAPRRHRVRGASQRSGAPAADAAAPAAG